MKKSLRTSLENSIEKFRRKKLKTKRKEQKLIFDFIFIVLLNNITIILFRLFDLSTISLSLSHQF
jgi:hypothetical protein